MTEEAKLDLVEAMILAGVFLDAMARATELVKRGSCRPVRLDSRVSEVPAWPCSSGRLDLRTASTGAMIRLPE